MNKKYNFVLTLMICILSVVMCALVTYNTNIYIPYQRYSIGSESASTNGVDIWNEKDNEIYLISHDSTLYGIRVLNSNINDTIITSDSVYKIVDKIIIKRGSYYDDLENTINSKWYSNLDRMVYQVCIPGTDDMVATVAVKL